MLKNTRQSNLELLRIIAMMLVMFVHYLPLRIPNTCEMLFINPLKVFYNFEVNSISIICVHCFILISGFFGIRWKIKSFGGLIFQLLYWAIAGYLIAKYLINPYFHSGLSFSVHSFITSMMEWYQGRWFPVAYLTLYILSPIINSFIQNTTEKELTYYILIFYIFSTIYGWMLGSREFGNGLSVISLSGLYMIGAWLKKSSYKFISWNKWNDLLCFVGCTIILTFSSAAMLTIGIDHSLYGYLNPIVIIESIFLFQFFRKLNIGNVPIINFFAAGAFAAFLLHCHPYLGDYCNGLWQYLNESTDCSSIFVICSIIILFAIAVIIDRLRIYAWESLTQTQLYSLVAQYLTPPRKE